MGSEKKWAGSVPGVDKPCCSCQRLEGVKELMRSERIRLRKFVQWQSSLVQHQHILFARMEQCKV